MPVEGSCPTTQREDFFFSFFFPSYKDNFSAPNKINAKESGLIIIILVATQRLYANTHHPMRWFLSWQIPRCARGKSGLSR